MKNAIRTITSLLLCTAIYFSCFPISASAIGDTSYVSITPVKQKMDFWCWAACSEMCGKTVDPSSPLTQTDVVKLIKGSIVNETGAGEDILRGVKFVARNKKSFTLKPIDFNTLVIKIKAKEAVIANGRNEIDPKNPGHTLLIHGTVFYDGEGGSQYSVYYCDPYDAKTYFCDYDSFCDGSYSDFSVYTVICTV